MSEEVRPLLARRWGVYAQPKPNEEHVVLALERAFPGSQWIEDQPLPASTAPTSESGSSTTGGGTTPLEGGAGAVLSHRLQMLATLDRALAFGAHEGAGKTPPEPGGLFDYGVIGGAKFDAPTLELWLSENVYDQSIVAGSGRGAEAAVLDLCPSAIELPKRKDLYGPKAGDCQVEDVCARARTIVLVGTGSRVTTARNWLKRFGENYRPPVIEIGAK